MPRPLSSSSRSLSPALPLAWILSLSAGNAAPAAPVLRPSDVAFMYEGRRETYEAYGATVLAWGGTPSPKSLEAARGVRFFGSVGMVTEFGAFHRRVRDRYEEALCRDPEGRPVKVPWLVDHQSDGVPFWWCCTRQPLFREFLRDRVVETLRSGAAGLHIDDHLGTAGGLWLDLCFCDRCIAAFRTHLAGVPAPERTRLGVDDPATYDFRSEVRRWRAASTPGTRPRPLSSHPLWPQWEIYHCRFAATVMRELHDLANQTAGHPVPMGANAGLLWPRHLSDYQAIDLFTAETDHHAASRRVPDLPVFAYRLAESLDRPYAATASGGDWAYIKEHGLPGLVRTWIALGYAAGQRLMAPHRQWCHTPEKGTHWYAGPTDRFAPLYQFVRAHPDLFDGLQTHADLAVLLPHAAFLADSSRWFDIANRLSASNISYRVILAGDAIVDHPLDPSDLARARHILAPARDLLLPADQSLFSERLKSPGVHMTVEEALAAVRPAVQVTDPALQSRLRLFPRIAPATGRALIHVLNTDYDPATDDVRPVDGIVLAVDTAALGLGPRPHARIVTPDGDSVDATVRDGRIELGRLRLWNLVALGP